MCPWALEKNCPACSGANYVEVAHSHMIGAKNQSCGSGPLPHNWLQLRSGQFLQKLSPGYYLEKAANMEFSAAQHAAGANYVEVAHSHMNGARNQSCGSGPLPHNWLQLHAGQLLQKLKPWRYALENAASMEFRAAQHAAGANLHSHMIGARNQLCGSGPFPHDWCQLHAGLPMPWKRLHVPWERLIN